MSADPQMMAQMLASQLGGGQAVGGQAVQQPALGAAAQLAQKIMLMQALQKGAPPPQQPQGPGGFPLPPGQALPQAMNAQPAPGAVNA